MSTYGTQIPAHQSAFAENVPSFSQERAKEESVPHCLDIQERFKFDRDEHLIDLRNLAIDPDKAADLRMRLSCFAEDWDHPDMDAYDHL